MHPQGCICQPLGYILIKSNISRMLGERKIRIADVARETGLSRKAITLLYQETGTRIEFETLNRLCAYLKCEVGELLEYVPDAELPKS